MCQAVRAEGSNRTHAARTRAGSGASMIGSCHTVPVNQSPGIRLDAIVPQGRISITSPPMQTAALIGGSAGFGERSQGRASPDGTAASPPG